MNPLLTCYARTIHALTWTAAHFVSFKEPKVEVGASKIVSIPYILKKNQKQNVFIVTGKHIYASGLLKPLLDELDKEEISYFVYHEVSQNPTIENVNIGFRYFEKRNADSIIAFGGGSVLDCAKIIGAKYHSPSKDVSKMKGLLKIHRKMPLFIAVPTTAGSGSEASLAAVIMDPSHSDKYAISSPKLIPDYAVLDPTLLVGLPASVSAASGMDALTHAIEAYIGHENTHKTKRFALEAIKLIFDNLENSVNEPANLEYREKMQVGAYKAGVAFTRALVGDVHAISHALGGKYNVSHGYANAILLPRVLEAYGKSAEYKLAKISDYLGIGEGLSKHEKAQLLIKEIDNLNQRLNLVNNFQDIIKDEDIEFLANHAYKEGAIIYPMPRILSREEIAEILIGLKNS